MKKILILSICFLLLGCSQKTVYFKVYVVNYCNSQGCNYIQATSTFLYTYDFSLEDYFQEGHCYRALVNPTIFIPEITDAHEINCRTKKDL